MGLEELFIIPLIAMMTEAAAETAVIVTAVEFGAIAATEAAMIGAAEATMAGAALMTTADLAAITAASEIATMTAVEGAAAVGGLTAAEVGGAITADAVLQVEMAEAASGILTATQAEAWALPEAVALGDAAMADEIMAQAALIEMDTIGESIAGSMEGGLLTPAAALQAVLDGLDKMIPGSKQLLGSIADGKINIPAMLQVLTGTLKLLGPLGPGIAGLLKLHTVTANRHIPAAVGALQVLFGKMIAHPTTADSGIIMNVGAVKEALGAMGMRFSDEGEFPDVTLIQPLGNVIAESEEAQTDRLVDTLMKAKGWDIKERQEQAARQAETDRVKAIAEQELLALQVDKIVAATTAGQQGVAQVLHDVRAETKEGWNKLVKGITGLDEELGAALRSIGYPTLEEQVGWIHKAIIPPVRLVAKLVEEMDKYVGEPVAKAIAPLFGKELENVRNAFMDSGRIPPEGALDKAQTLFELAVKFGFRAHGLAAAVEVAHPFKELGIPQLAAAMADIGAFGPVASNTLSVMARAAIGRPMQWQVNKLTQSNLMDPRAAEQTFLEGRLSWAAYRERLEYEGWPKEQIDAFLGETDDGETAVPYREPTARELGVIYEDITVDEPWILKMIRQSGYSAGDAEQVLKGVKLRAMKSLRQGLLSEAEGAYEEGTLAQAEFELVLEELGVRDVSRRLIMRRATIGRTRAVTKLLEAKYKTLVDGDVISTDDYRAALGGIGYEEDLVQAKVAAADAKAEVRIFKSESTAAKAQLRLEQQLTAASLDKQVRLGLITPDVMETLLIVAGYVEQQARAMATLSGLKALPVPRLPEVLSAEAADQRIREVNSQAIETLVAKGAMDGAVGLMTLLQLGFDIQEATARIALATARGWKPAAVPPPPKETAEQRSVRTIKTQDAVAAYRGGLADDALLAQLLTEAGHTPDYVDAIVSRELTRMIIEGEKAWEKAAADAEKQATAAVEESAG